MTKEHITRLKEFFQHNVDMFAQSLKDLEGTDLIKFSIDTQGAAPIRQRPCKQNPRARQELQNQIKEMLDAVIIEQSDSA